MMSLMEQVIIWGLAGQEDRCESWKFREQELPEFHSLPLYPFYEFRQIVQTLCSSSVSGAPSLNPSPINIFH